MHVSDYSSNENGYAFKQSKACILGHDRSLGDAKLQEWHFLFFIALWNRLITFWVFYSDFPVKSFRIMSCHATICIYSALIIIKGQESRWINNIVIQFWISARVFKSALHFNWLFRKYANFGATQSYFDRYRRETSLKPGFSYTRL